MLLTMGERLGKLMGEQKKPWIQQVQVELPSLKMRKIKFIKRLKKLRENSKLQEGNRMIFRFLANVVEVSIFNENTKLFQSNTEMIASYPEQYTDTTKNIQCTKFSFGSVRFNFI